MTDLNRGTVLVGRRGAPKWIWLAVLLGLLVLLALLWLLLTKNGNGLTVGASPLAPGATPQASAAVLGGSPAGSGAITDFSALLNPSDPSSLAGNRVTLTNVTVQKVVGDTTFWAGPSADQQVLVAIEEDPTSGPVEGGIKVVQGQTISLDGVVRQMPSTSEAKSRWNLSDADASALDGQKVFIRAQHVQVSQ
jgi:hypothetical protein